MFLACYASSTLGCLTIQQPDSTATKQSKITPGIPSTYDWLKLFDGSEMEVEVRRISEKYVFFSEPGNMDTDWMDRRKIKTIYYRTGTVEQLNSSEQEIKETKDWQTIVLTKSPQDVNDHIKIDDINVKFESKSRQHYRSAKALERSAEIVIMKQAANMNADVVLITKVSHIRAYGDAPVVNMVGETYRKK